MKRGASDARDVMDSGGRQSESASSGIGRSGGPGNGAQERGDTTHAVEVVVVAAVRSGEASGGGKRRGADVGVEELQQAFGAVAHGWVSHVGVETVEVHDVDGGVGGARVFAHAEERDVEGEGVEALDTFLEHVAAIACLAEENEVRGVHDRDVRVGVAHTVGEAARDGAVENREELLLLGG